MIDLEIFRNQFDIVQEGISKKKFECDLNAIRELDNQRRSIVTEAEQMRAQQKAANQDMAKLPKGTPEFEEKLKQMKLLSEKVKQLEESAKEVEQKWKSLFLTIPNIPHSSVPVGKTAEDNVVFSTWGDVNAVSP